MFTEQLTQGLSFQDGFNTAVVNNATAYSFKWFDMSTVKRVIYVIDPSSITAGVSYYAQLIGRATANIAATNTAITGTNTGALTTNNQIATIEVRSDQVTNFNSTYRYVSLQLVTNGVATLTAIGIGSDSIQKPASQYNLNSTFIAPATICNL